MKELPKKYLNTKQRKEMWADAKNMITKIDKELDFSEIHVIGSMISNKKPNDIDFAVVTKAKANSAYPIDLIVLPQSANTKEYLKFFDEYMKKKYGKGFRPVKIK
jgi:hypothetical protein